MDIHLMYLLATASAQHSLLIENAYFLPDDLMRKELIAAAKRGAKVEILVPGEHIDQGRPRRLPKAFGRNYFRQESNLTNTSRLWCT